MITQNSLLQKDLLLEVSGLAQPGANLVTNGGFDSGANWTVNGGWAIADGKATFTDGGGTSYLEQAFTITSGVTYRISFVISGCTTGSIIILNDSGTPIGSNILGEWQSIVNGTYQYVTKASATTNTVRVYAQGTYGSFSFDNVVIRPLHSEALTSPDPSYTFTNTGAIPTYGHKGNNSYYAFDGVDDGITFTPISAFTTNDFSITATIMLNNYGNNDSPIVSGDYTYPENGAFTFAVSNDGYLKVLRYGNENELKSNVHIALGGLYHIAYKRSGSTGIFYLDGIPKDTVTDNINYDYGCRYIGGQPILGYYYNGSIHSLQIFNYALSASEVAYYSNPANHLKAVDQGATGVDLLSGLDFTSGWGVINAVIDDSNTFHTTSDGYYGIFKSLLSVGKAYNITIAGTISTGLLRVDNANEQVYISGLSGTFSTSTKFTVNTQPFLAILASVIASVDITSLSVVQAGCVLSLTPEGMLGSPTQGIWRDNYHSTDIPLSGETAPRLVRSWSGMNAWRFNGTTSHLTKASPTTGLPTGTADRTLVAWVFGTRIGSVQTIFKYGNSAANQTFSVSTYLDGTVFVGAYANDSDRSTTVAPINTWTHIAVVLSESATKIQFYINGVLDRTVAWSGASTVLNELSVGFFDVANSQYFPGIIENPRLYSGALSAEQIALDYASYND